MGTPAISAPPPSAPAPSAAPSAPAPAAPSSSPAAPQAPPSSGPPASPGSEPVVPAAAPPTTPAGPFDPVASPTAPKPEAYGNNRDDQAQFLTDLKRWERSHPDGEAAPPAPDAQLTPEQQALKDALPQAEQQAQPPAAPEVAPTPQALAEMMDKNPKLKEFFDANPAEKGAFFKMSRELAEAAPIRAIFPTVGDAEFAQEYSTAMVGLKTASMRLIDNPEAAGDFISVFDQQFQRVGADGQPIMENGKPVYDADRDVVRNAVFNSRLSEVKEPIGRQIAELKAKLAGAYPSDNARAADQNRLDNLSYAETALGVLDSIMDGSFFEEGPPELSPDATPEQKAWFEGEQAKLAKQKQELEDKKLGANKEERTAASQKFTSDVRNDMGGAVGGVIGNAIKAAEDSGVYIPEFYKQEKFVDPKTGKETNTSAMAVRIFTAFENALMKPGSRTLMEITNHELLPQTEQTRQLRKDYYARKAAEMIPGPDGLAQKEVDRIQGLVKLDEEKLTARTAKRNEVVQPEPGSGGSALPSGASREQMIQAAEEAAKKFATDSGVDWNSLSGSEKQARILTQNHRLNRK